MADTNDCTAIPPAVGCCRAQDPLETFPAPKLDWIMPHSAPCFFLSLPSNGAMEQLAQTQDPHPFTSLGQSSPPSPDVKPFSDRSRPCQTAERRKRRAQQTLHLGSAMAYVSPAPLPAVLG
jgi:hypothetical protein